METLPSSAVAPALALMRRIGGAPEIGEAELAELRALGPAVWLGERDGDRVLGMVLCGRSPVRREVFGVVWLGVAPEARGQGLGGALLEAAEARARTAGATRIVIGGRPGGYLVPGIAAEREDVRAWLRKRGYEETGRAADLRVVLGEGYAALAKERASDLARRVLREGYVLARAGAGDTRVAEWVGRHFGRSWRHEVGVALGRHPACVHVALAGRRVVGFAAHSARLAQLGTFGPTGVLPRHRGQRLGEALLWRCLGDLARARHDAVTIAWVGPREFYAKTCGAAVEREYVLMARALTPSPA